MSDEYTTSGVLPDPPKEPDMQQRPHIADIDTILRQHFARRPDVLVGGEGYLCYDTRDRDNWLVPDCVVAFGVDPEAILGRNGYVISQVGKPPDLVLEVASKTTAITDDTRKREGYARHGVSEYWRFDATGGERYAAALAGDLLVNGVYQSIELHREPDGLVWGHSPVLGLDLCWDDGRLRFYDPVAEEYLRDLAESEARGNAAEAERDAERAARDIAKARAANAEAELQQLREQLRRQSG
jgi:Uma2 family endonuclease